MALLAGTTSTADSMAKSIFDAIESEFGIETDATLNATRKQTCNAIAAGIVSHIASFADVRITTADAGLQRDNTGGNPATLAPSADVVLSGAVE